MAKHMMVSPITYKQNTTHFRFGSILPALLLVILSLVVIAYVTVVLLKEDTLLGEHYVCTVMSSNMAPTLEMGSLILVQDIPPEMLKVGDMITFKDPDTSALITHRITNIQSGRSFITRGDAAFDNDQMTVPAANIMGKVTFQMNGLGYFIDFLHTRYGLYTLAILPFLLWFMVELCLYLRRTSLSRQGSGQMRTFI